MSRPRLDPTLLATITLLTFAACRPALGDEPGRQRVTGEAAILAALEQEVSIDWIDEPVTGVVRHLRENLRIEAYFDHQAFEAVNLGADFPVTAVIKGVKLRSALDSILAPVGACWMITDEVLLITSPEELSRHMTTRIYDLGDLLTVYDLQGRPWQDFDSLVTAIESSIAPDSWQIRGGDGTLAPLSYRGANVLVVRQTLRVHEQVTRLLGELSACADKHGEDRFPRFDPVIGACEMVRRRVWSGRPGMGGQDAALLRPEEVEAGHPDRAQERLLSALEETVSLNFIDESLHAVAAYLRERHQIELQIDLRALDQINMDVQTPVTFTIANVKLRSALNLMLRELDLTWVVGEGIILITTPEEASTHLTPRTYDLGNLATVYDTDGNAEQYFLPLIYVMEATVEPESWEVLGGPCSIIPIQCRGANVLVIRQTQEGHRQIAAILKALTSIADRYGDDVFPVVEPRSDGIAFGSPFLTPRIPTVGDRDELEVEPAMPEFLPLDAGPRMRVAEVTVPSAKTSPLAIRLQVEAVGETPVAFRQDQLTVDISGARTAWVWDADAEFGASGPEIITVEPGKPQVLSFSASADRGEGHRKWSELPPGQYTLRVYLHGGKNLEFDYQWRGQTYSDDFLLTIE